MGYLYQAQYALYALLTADDEESALILEGLDDVELQMSAIRQAVLSTCSPDRWKALQV